MCATVLESNREGRDDVMGFPYIGLCNSTPVTNCNDDVHSVYAKTGGYHEKNLWIDDWKWEEKY